MTVKAGTPRDFYPNGSRLRAFLAAFLSRVLAGCLVTLFFLMLTGLQAQTPLTIASTQRTVIIDTDAGSDDLMAIAFLLSRPDVRIEAVTLANGLAHVSAGGRNILRLLELAGRRDIPVYLGRETPLSGSAAFPAEWRRLADELPGVTLPKATRSLEHAPAAEFLAKRLTDATQPVELLALGPLTNLAEAFSRAPQVARLLRQLVIMGGAVRVPGNLGDGGVFKTDNVTAEWNLFVDPSAAKTVFSSGAPIRLVPLDATQRVPVDMALLERLESGAKTPLARFVAQVLATDREYIRQGFYFAWDPLAAVALVDPRVASFKPIALEISDKPSEQGRTIELQRRRANAQVALNATALRFRKIFLKTLGIE